MKNKNLFLSTAFIVIVFLCSITSCRKESHVFSKELESKIERIEVDKVFSLDTIQGGEWTHFCIITPYMDPDSLITTNNIKCKEADLSELKTLTMLDNINTLLILRADMLKKVEILSRSVIDFSDIAQTDLGIFSSNQTFIINKNRSARICEDSNH
ncbi:hypothetical protein [Porphyromonas sp.]|uniref:hypothetical protein n=1 Tax=Porphyromonas sp. TaxID=1924944 RepID=UPI0026DD0063|nr:hypothetical protein [Porphyromonas sp.]MDO4695203.1 hypothetical protein [Porphyromonas sp.]MDO4770997.1 hypothetical protein [Porphyromonas sp.]